MESSRLLDELPASPPPNSNQLASNTNRALPRASSRVHEACIRTNTPMKRHKKTRASADRRMAPKIGLVAVVIHLCKGNIGPGAMSLPSGFSHAGIYASPVLFILVCLVCIYNMDLLLYCKLIVSPHTPLSFGEVGGKILGPKGKKLIDIFLVGTQLGICCVYFTFIATNIHAILPKKWQEAIHERQLILLIYPFILMLSWIRTLDRITPFSSLANVAVFIGISIVFYYSLSDLPSDIPRTTPVKMDWTKFPEFYGTAVYSFEGIGLILPIQNEMKEPSRFSRINALVMIFILVLFLFLGEMPVLAFGKITNGSITAVLREYYDGLAVTLSNLLLAFACTLSFPIQFYPALEVLERALHEKGSFLRPELNSMSAEMEQKMEIERKTHHEPPKYMEFNPHLPLEDSLSKSIIEINTGTNKLPMYTPRGTYRPEKDNINQSIVDKVFKAVSMSQYECNRTIFRSMLCTSLMIVAVCVPDVALLISLFGSVGSSMLAIVLPPFLYLKLMKSQHQSCPQVLSFWSICFHWMIIVLGTIGMIVGTWQAFYDVFQTLFSY